jgi:hypothetical protein
MWKHSILLLLLSLIVVAAGDMTVGESVSGFVTVRLIRTQATEMTDSQMILFDYVMACDRFFEENTNDGIVNLNVRLFHTSVPNGPQRRRNLRRQRSLQDTTTSTTQILDTTLLLTGVFQSSSISTSPEDWEDTLPRFVNQNTTGFIAILKDPTAYMHLQTYFEPLTHVEAYSVKQVPSSSSSAQDGAMQMTSTTTTTTNSTAIAAIVAIVTMGAIAFGILIVMVHQQKRRRRENRLSTFPSSKMDALSKNQPSTSNNTTKENLAPEEEEDPAVTKAVAA